MNPNEVLPVGIIYKIESADSSKVYFGSTKNFKKRIDKHKEKLSAFVKGSFKKNLAVFEIITTPAYKASIVQEHKNIKRCDLEAIEGEFILKHNCVNKIVPGRAQRFKHTNTNNQTGNYRSEQCKCNICKGQYTRRHQAKHFNTQKHIQALGQQIQDIKNTFSKVLQDLQKKQNIININDSHTITINNN
jgi:predicted GIY-YIG superfamily endonuclease